jgi:hypothetical protein
VKHRQTDSAIWADLLKIRDIYLQGRKVIIGNGKKTLFWKDKWLYEKSLEVLFPDLFAMCLNQNITVEQVKKDPIVVKFTRWLVDRWRNDWEQILVDTFSVNMGLNDDTVSWRFGFKGLFSVKSVYNALTINESG